MADLDNLPGCCGINELMYIRDDASPEESLMSASVDDLNAHVVFSVTSRETKRHRKGVMLARYIKKHKLGTVVATPRAAKNPGHIGTLKAWIWTPNKRNLRAWQARMRKQDPVKYYDGDVYDPYRNGYW